MSSLIKLAEESVGAYLVSKKVMDTQVESAQRVVLKKSADVVSSALSLLLLSLSGLLAALFLFLLVGYGVFYLTNNAFYLFGIPFLLISVLSFILWHRRKRVFHHLAKRVLEDLVY